MDWIEQIFGWNLDNGDGSIESLIVSFAVIAASIGVGVTIRRWRRRLDTNRYKLEL
jgi:hypothetical protein